MKIIPSVRQKKFILQGKNAYISISRDGKTKVKNTVEGGAQVRLLLVNDTRESATYTLPMLRMEPVFDYVRLSGSLMLQNEAYTKILLIGGAGFSLPKYVLTYGKDKVMTVVEKDPEMIRIAERYFYLDELIAAQRLRETKRLNIVTEDGFVYLMRTKETYDLVMNDAFSGNVPDAALSSERGFSAVKEHLNAGGLYIVNLITALSGAYAMPGEMAIALAKRHFAHVKLVPARTDDIPARRQNCLLLCSDEAL